MEADDLILCYVPSGIGAKSAINSLKLGPIAKMPREGQFTVSRVKEPLTPRRLYGELKRKLTKDFPTKTQLYPTNYKYVPNCCQRLRAVFCSTKNTEEIKIKRIGIKYGYCRSDEIRRVV